MPQPPLAFPPFPPFAPSPPAPPYPPFPPYPMAPRPTQQAFGTGGGTNTGQPAGNGAPSGSSAPPPPAPPAPPPAPPPPPPPGLTGNRSPFPVSAIPLSADSGGLYQGTGTFSKAITVVDPASVAGTGQLRFGPANATITSMLFQLDTPDAPNWCAVAVPAGVTDFSRVHVFFHPIPYQGGYRDVDYPHKYDPTYKNVGRPWELLFYLIERVGYQSAASAQPMPVVMPFFTTAATDTGIFAPNWNTILSDILTDARTAMGVPGLTPVDVATMVISSHSVGIVYLAAFMSKAPGLLSVLSDVWDFDGHASTSASLSDALKSTATYKAVKYDQGGGTNSFAVPGSRWAGLPVPVAYPPYLNHSDVHHLIRDFLLVHAATLM